MPIIHRSAVMEAFHLVFDAYGALVRVEQDPSQLNAQRLRDLLIRLRPVYPRFRGYVLDSLNHVQSQESSLHMLSAELRMLGVDDPTTEHLETIDEEVEQLLNDLLEPLDRLSQEDYELRHAQTISSHPDELKHWIHEKDFSMLRDILFHLADAIRNLIKISMDVGAQLQSVQNELAQELKLLSAAKHSAEVWASNIQSWLPAATMQVSLKTLHDSPGLDEKKFPSLEKERTNALEVATQAYEERKTSPTT